MDIPMLFNIKLQTTTVIKEKLCEYTLINMGEGVGIVSHYFITAENGGTSFAIRVKMGILHFS